jgi:hypothetical protein
LFERVTKYSGAQRILKRSEIEIISGITTFKKHILPTQPITRRLVKESMSLIKKTSHIVHQGSLLLKNPHAFLAPAFSTCFSVLFLVVLFLSEP